jgi:hypothetical protein
MVRYTYPYRVCGDGMNLANLNAYIYVILIGVVAVLIVGFVWYVRNGVHAKANTEQFLKTHGLSGKSLPEMIALLEDRWDMPSQFKAHITPSHLIMSDASTKVKIKLPKDQIYIALAPYLRQMHSCYHHNFTTCRGELAEETFVVVVMNLGTGGLVMKEVVQSYRNGFIGLWLPVDQKLIIAVNHEGKSADIVIQSSKNTATCLTELRLEWK